MVIGYVLGTVYGGYLGAFDMEPSWAMWKDFWVEIGNGPQLGNREG